MADRKTIDGSEKREPTICYGCMTMQTAAVCPVCGYDRNQEVSPVYLRPGTILAKKYLIGKVIGHGGFGITYLAFDTVLGIKLAVKEYLVQEYASREPSGRVIAHAGEAKDRFEEGISRFLEEARSLARCEGNAGIVSVRDFFRANGTAYLVMMYLEGMNLRQYLAEKGPMPYDRVRQEILPVITGALTAVHKAGMLHRDISPDNLFLTSQGQVVIIDFGAAREVMSSAKSMSIILKPGYAPEEQYRTRGKQGPWTDVYAVAATIYRAITGKVPPESLDRLENDPLIPPSKFCDISPAHEKVLLKAMSVKAESRYQSMLEFYSAVLAAQEEASEGVTMSYRGGAQSTSRNAPVIAPKGSGATAAPRKRPPAQKTAPAKQVKSGQTASARKSGSTSASSTTYGVIKILIGIVVIFAVVATAFVLIRLILNQLTGSIPDILLPDTTTSQAGISPSPDTSPLATPSGDSLETPDPNATPTEDPEPSESPEPEYYPDVSHIEVRTIIEYGDAITNALAYVPSTNREITYGVSGTVGNLIYYTAKPSSGNVIVSRFITDGASLEHGKVEHFFGRDGSLYSYVESSGQTALIVPANARAGMAWTDSQGSKTIVEVSATVSIRGTVYTNCLVIMVDGRYAVYGIGIGEIAVVDNYFEDVQNPHLRLRYNEPTDVNMTPALESLSTQFALIN